MLVLLFVKAALKIFSFQSNYVADSLIYLISVVDWMVRRRSWALILDSIRNPSVDKSLALSHGWKVSHIVFAEGQGVGEFCKLYRNRILALRLKNVKSNHAECHCKSAEKSPHGMQFIHTSLYINYEKVCRALKSQTVLICLVPQGFTPKRNEYYLRLSAFYSLRLSPGLTSLCLFNWGDRNRCLRCRA